MLQIHFLGLNSTLLAARAACASCLELVFLRCAPETRDTRGVTPVPTPAGRDGVLIINLQCLSINSIKNNHSCQRNVKETLYLAYLSRTWKTPATYSPPTHDIIHNPNTVYNPRPTRLCTNVLKLLLTFSWGRASSWATSWRASSWARPSWRAPSWRWSSWGQRASWRRASSWSPASSWRRRAWSTS